MSTFESTSLWQRTLAARTGDEFCEQREKLRVAFLSFRERASQIAGEIGRDLPDLTVHDVTHLDALWEMADLIAGPQYELTPCEAFVLGGSFLIHDLGNGLAAYPDGVKAMYASSAWQDAVSLMLRRNQPRPPSREEIAAAPEQVRKEATFQVLRTLHAQQAERLALISWRDHDSGPERFLIDDAFLRETFGRTIGRIAHSHWWSLDTLKPEFDLTLGAPAFYPASWTVDPLKLACLLRVADAAHLDSRRSPSFLKTLRQPSRSSRNHWLFQEKLQQPILTGDRLVYSSGHSFTPDEAAAWWLCLESLQVLDRELAGADSVLADCLRPRFVARGVQGAEDASRLRKWVPTNGWVPVDAKIRVGDVAGLASRLGGAQLYGRDNLVPLREMVQNASDAVRARRWMEKRPTDFGDLTIQIGRDTEGDWIEVSDNGVGMSPRVLTGPLLDFGSTFWNSTLATTELPGLTASGFEPTGKYGIGFFSLFMWGNHVRVKSRSYRDAPRDTRILEFPSGLNARPILRDAPPEDFMIDSGTVVRVWLKSNPESKGGAFSAHGSDSRTLEETCRHLCSASDVNIYGQRLGGDRTQLIRASDWLTIGGAELLERVFERDDWARDRYDTARILHMAAQNLRPITDTAGEIIGRAAVIPVDEFGYPFGLGQVTVGGLRACGLSYIAGILKGASLTASRDFAAPIANGTALSQWATAQAALVSELAVPETALASAAEIIRRCGGETGELPIAGSAKGWLRAKAVREFVKQLDEVLLVESVYLRQVEQDMGPVELLGNVLTCTSGRKSIISSRQSYLLDEWPDPLKVRYERFMGRSNEAEVVSLLATSWATTVRKLLAASNITTDRKTFEATVAKAGGKMLTRPVHIMKRPKAEPPAREDVDAPPKAHPRPAKRAERSKRQNE
jgi:hypothetical protein